MHFSLLHAFGFCTELDELEEDVLVVRGGVVAGCAVPWNIFRSFTSLLVELFCSIASNNVSRGLEVLRLSKLVEELVKMFVLLLLFVDVDFADFLFASFAKPILARI